MTDFKNKASEDAVLRIANHLITTHAVLTHEAKCDTIKFFNGYVASTLPELSDEDRDVALQRIKARANAVCCDMDAQENEEEEEHHDDDDSASASASELQPIGCARERACAPCGRSKCVLYNGAVIDVSSKELASISRYHVYSSPLLMSDTRGGRVPFVDCDDNRKVWVVNPEKFNKKFGGGGGARIPQQHITYQQLRARGMSHMQALEWMMVNKNADSMPPPQVPRSSDYVYNTVEGQSIELKREQVEGIGSGVVAKSLEELVKTDPKLAVAFDFYSMGLFPAYRIYALFPGAMVFFPRKIKGKGAMVYAASVEEYSAAAARDPATYPAVSGTMERTFNLFRALGFNDDFSSEYARAFPFITPDDFMAMRAALDSNPTLSISDVVAVAAQHGNGVEMGIAGKLMGRDVYSSIGLQHIAAVPSPNLPSRTPLTSADAPKKDSESMAALRKEVSDEMENCSKYFPVDTLVNLMKDMSDKLVLVPGPGLIFARAAGSGVASAQERAVPVTKKMIEYLKISTFAFDRLSPRRRYLYPCTAMILVREKGDTYAGRRPDEIALFVDMTHYNNMEYSILNVGKMSKAGCVESTSYAFWASFSFLKDIPDTTALVKAHTKDGVFDTIGLRSQILRDSIAAMETVISTPGADISKSGFDADLTLPDMIAIVSAYKQGNFKKLITEDFVTVLENCESKRRITWPSRTAPKTAPSPFGSAGVAPPPSPKPASTKKASAATLFPKQASSAQGASAKTGMPDAQDTRVENDIIGRKSLDALNGIAWQVQQRNTAFRGKAAGPPTKQGLSQARAVTESSKHLTGLVIKRFDPRAPDAFPASKSVAAAKLRSWFGSPGASRMDVGPAKMGKNSVWQHPGSIFLVVRQPSNTKSALKPTDLAFFIDGGSYNTFLADAFGQEASREDVAASAQYALGAPVLSDNELTAFVASHTTAAGTNYLQLFLDTAAAAQTHLTKRAQELKGKTDAASKKEAREVEQQLKRIQTGIISRMIYDEIVSKPHTTSKSASSGKKGGTFSRLQRTLGLKAPKVSGRGSSTATPSTPATSTTKKKGGLFSRLRGYARRLVGDAIDGTAPIGSTIQPHHAHLFTEEVDKLLALSVACGLEADAIIAEGQ